MGERSGLSSQHGGMHRRRVLAAGSAQSSPLLSDRWKRASRAGRTLASPNRDSAGGEGSNSLKRMLHVPIPRASAIMHACCDMPAQGGPTCPWLPLPQAGRALPARLDRSMVGTRGRSSSSVLLVELIEMVCRSPPGDSGSRASGTPLAGGCRGSASTRLTIDPRPQFGFEPPSTRLENPRRIPT